VGAKPGKIQNSGQIECIGNGNRGRRKFIRKEESSWKRKISSRRWHINPRVAAPKEPCFLQQ
jgi:hypothetical protein